MPDDAIPALSYLWSKRPARSKVPGEAQPNGAGCSFAPGQHHLAIGLTGQRRPFGVTNKELKFEMQKMTKHSLWQALHRMPVGRARYWGVHGTMVLARIFSCCCRCCTYSFYLSVALVIGHKKEGQQTFAALSPEGIPPQIHILSLLL
jgi:hypothetical protein